MWDVGLPDGHSRHMRTLLSEIAVRQETKYTSAGQPDPPEHEL